MVMTEIEALLEALLLDLPYIIIAEIIGPYFKDFQYISPESRTDSSNRALVIVFLKKGCNNAHEIWYILQSYFSEVGDFVIEIKDDNDTTIERIDKNSLKDDNEDIKEPDNEKKIRVIRK
jgi:hypothetical protein